MRLIGDVHGNRNQNMTKYVALTQECDASVQVGDFGAGFVELPKLSLNHCFIRGNHDNLEVCKTSLNWIPDGTFQDGVFYIGGARSIDVSNRLIGRDWWDDEELSFPELDKMINLYEQHKPHTVISHDCPRSVAVAFWTHLRDRGSRTAVALEQMFEAHQPNLWVFGHHHSNVHRKINGTEFICLAELSYIDL